MSSYICQVYKLDYWQRNKILFAPSYLPVDIMSAVSHKQSLDDHFLSCAGKLLLEMKQHVVNLASPSGSHFKYVQA